MLCFSFNDEFCFGYQPLFVLRCAKGLEMRNVKILSTAAWNFIFLAFRYMPTWSPIKKVNQRRTRNFRVQSLLNLRTFLSMLIPFLTCFKFCHFISFSWQRETFWSNSFLYDFFRFCSSLSLWYTRIHSRTHQCTHIHALIHALPPSLLSFSILSSWDHGSNVPSSYWLPISFYEAWLPKSSSACMWVYIRVCVCVCVHACARARMQ